MVLLGGEAFEVAPGSARGAAEEIGVGRGEREAPRDGRAAEPPRDGRRGEPRREERQGHGERRGAQGEHAQQDQACRHRARPHLGQKDPHAPAGEHPGRPGGSGRRGFPFEQAPLREEHPDEREGDG
ncbi:MAG TPA: hypothetical protein VFX50_18290, partial [Gemmatimonadales bacterium]|nr:hypothetical protein [Gemmatimonadales bacterium]